jgi:ABC-type phosphate transport system substrate-binding protein
LPAKKITIVHRSDGSGTTFNFVNYLSKVSPQWKAKVGEGTSVKWPTGIGGKGNEGVAAYVKQISGGIGYVELSYALQNHMAYARLKNAAGNFVLPSDESFSAAAASAGLDEFEGLLSRHDERARRETPGRSPPPTSSSCTDSRRMPLARNRRGSSSAGRMQMATRRPRRSTTCRCRMRWSSRSRRTGRSR